MQGPTPDEGTTPDHAATSPSTAVPHDAAGAPPIAGRKEWVGLAVLAVPALLIAIDVFVLVLALPQLSAELGANSTEQLWIMDIYPFMVAGFLITMGTLGDRIGRRRLLMIGAAAFVGASVISAYAPTAELLIVARALLGVAGATLGPSTLSLISNMFLDPRQRGLAIGVWTSCFTVGAIIGPMIGGVMLEHFWWGSVFLLGVPPLAALLVLGPVLLPEFKDQNAGRMDFRSVLLSLAAILPVIHGLKELARHGWAPAPAVTLVAGLAVGVLFLRRQRTLDDPLLDLRLFRNRAFSTALLCMMFMTMLGGTTMIFFAQHLQLVQGRSPLSTAFAMVPGMAASTVSFLGSPMLARRIPPGRLISSGLSLAVAGMLMFTQVGPEPSVMPIVAFVLMALGSGPLITLGIDYVVGSAPPERAGSAAAISETSHEFGYATGIATLGSLATALYRGHVTDALPAGVPDAAADLAREGIAGAAAVAATLPAGTAEALMTVARDAFGLGLHVMAALGAVVMLGISVAIGRVLRHLGATGATTGAATAAGDTAANDSDTRIDGDAASGVAAQGAAG